MRAGAERQLVPRVWDEHAVGNSLDAEINAVKKQFMQQQLQAHTTNFGLPTSRFHHTTALQGAANATEDVNATSGNATVTNGTDAGGSAPLIAFDNEWFANWYEWYDSNYGSSYTARKEEHVARILGTQYNSPYGGSSVLGGSDGRKYGRAEQGSEQGQQNRAGQKEIFARKPLHQSLKDAA